MACPFERSDATSRSSTWTFGATQIGIDERAPSKEQSSVYRYSGRAGMKSEWVGSVLGLVAVAIPQLGVTTECIVVDPSKR